MQINAKYGISTQNNIYCNDTKCGTIRLICDYGTSAFVSNNNTWKLTQSCIILSISSTISRPSGTLYDCYIF